MSHNPLSYFFRTNSDDMDELIGHKLTIQEELTHPLISDDEIDYHIIAERNQSFHEIAQDMESLAETTEILSKLVYEQGEDLDVAEENIDHAVINTETALNHLERASEYVKDRIIIARDIGIVVGGGLLGAGGFILGPFVGIGTMIAGGAAGGAVVTGLHKVDIKRNQKK